jgi:hypothetical protein
LLIIPVRVWAIPFEAFDCVEILRIERHEIVSDHRCYSGDVGECLLEGDAKPIFGVALCDRGGVSRDPSDCRR